MRELTAAELELISGGYDNGEDIVVTGSPYHPPYYQPPQYYPTPGYYPPTSPPPHYGTGVVNPPPAPTFDQATDRQVDALSMDLAAKIKAKPDSDHQEYGAWIYRDANGNIKESTILKGPDWGTSPFGRPLQDFDIPDGATLLGQIHNHPSLNPNGQELTGRANPDNFDLNAISNAGYYAQPNHNIKVDETNFRGYILHDNQVDEYDRVTHQGTYDTSNGQIREYPGTARDSVTTLPAASSGGSTGASTGSGAGSGSSTGTGTGSSGGASYNGGGGRAGDGHNYNIP
ncbi:hypothetical protein KV697_11140 [Sphingomonas sanguinis]|uniref:hypothetical protein n=1 Tax=Sphingomonas sanguinis TaxID=33051 RepID=UPI001C5612CE|nr:hypothetical protein [Sphingomonas sanguinis]QXT34381.1 hypothetical protein KV697_11140 [Sphingomonas sanguinis]